MKIIFNQDCLEEKELLINYSSKNYFSGDLVNAYGWYFQSKLLFWEDIYFQLMASLRKMRISIPLSYTPEMFEKQIKLLFNELHLSQGRYKITVFSNPDSSDIPSFIIESLAYKDFFTLTVNEMDVYKEIPVCPTLISPLSVFHPVNRIAKQYARENDLQELILLNQEKRIARSISGNIFLMTDSTTIYSNSVAEGALLSPLKKNFITFLREKTEYVYREENISPFQTQSALEVFILSDEKGIIPVTKIRKNTFSSEQTRLLTKKFIGYALEQNS